ncbi:MAG: hypothetical protein HGA45_02745 [Chloroflexales bacterium]|nr:hypothetical protein [Chloroflexales bacterium]
MALTNVIRHAHARRVSVTLSRQEDLPALGICDDGAGFDVHGGAPRPPPALAWG